MVDAAHSTGVAAIGTSLEQGSGRWEQGDMAEIKSGDSVFTREDALRLCQDWQDHAWGKPHRHTADNIENMIEELCLAFGCTVEEVRATWWSTRRHAACPEHHWKPFMEGKREWCERCGMTRETGSSHRATAR